MRMLKSKIVPKIFITLLVSVLATGWIFASHDDEADVQAAKTLMFGGGAGSFISLGTNIAAFVLLTNADHSFSTLPFYEAKLATPLFHLKNATIAQMAIASYIGLAHLGCLPCCMKKERYRDYVRFEGASDPDCVLPLGFTFFLNTVFNIVTATLLKLDIVDEAGTLIQNSALAPTQMLAGLAGKRSAYTADILLWVAVCSLPIAALTYKVLQYTVLRVSPSIDEPCCDIEETCRGC